MKLRNIMRSVYQWFELTPKIVKVQQPVSLILRTLSDQISFIEGCTYKVTIAPLEEKTGQNRETLLLRPLNGVLVIPNSFEAEQEYVVIVEEAPEDNVGVSTWRLPRSEFHIYALQEDLFDRRPYKGDLHIHSKCSDGKDSPAHVAAYCRRIGLDFMAVTDHHQYRPSVEAISAFEKVPHDLGIFPGEEIHPPENRVHIVNFGGRFSVNEWIKQNEPDYHREVKAIEETIQLLDGVLRAQYASCLWCYDKIREAGGLGIFCHPYWISNHAYNVPEPLIAIHLEQQPFAAFELIGGMHRHEAESNLLQVARYHEMRAQGKQLPIVGVSDAHGCETGELFGWYYTVVFARSLELQDIIQGIQELYSVAIECLPGETPRAHGPFRLVKYAQFLMREVFPHHDAFCQEEGQLMLAYLAGDPASGAALQACQGQTTRFYEDQWALNSQQANLTG